MTKSDLQKTQERADFLRRLGYFIFGLAIGCVLVGVLFSARARMLAPPQRPGDSSVNPAQAPATAESAAPAPTP